MTTAPLTIDPWQDGASFLVKAHPGARRDALAGVHDGMVKIDTTAAPEKGKANKAIVKFLAKQLGVPAATVEVVSGGTNPKKRIGVHGLSPETLSAQLSALLA